MTYAHEMGKNRSCLCKDGVYFVWIWCVYIGSGWSWCWLCGKKCEKYRKYDKPGQSNKPEWGISCANKNLPLLEPFRAEKYFEQQIEN